MRPQIIAALNCSVAPGLSGDKLSAAFAAVVASGYDGVYLPQGPGLYEPLELAAYLAATDSLALKVFAAQRAGLIAPTMCSRMFATLDQLTHGKLVVVLDTVGDTAPEGDALDETQKLARAHEYAQIMRDLWGADKPIDHAGPHYRFNKARTNVPPLQKGALPILLGCAPSAVLQQVSAFSGVVLSGANLAHDDVAPFTARGLRVAVVMQGASEHTLQAVAALAKAGADTFMVTPESLATEMTAPDPSFVERCRTAATLHA